MADQKVSYIIDGKNLLSRTLAQIDKDAQKAENSVNAVGKGGVGQSSGGGLLKSIVGGNLIASGIQSGTSALIGFGKESVMAFSKYEQFGVALTTMFHGNKLEAEQLSNELVGFAKKTPFALTEVQDATKQLIAYGSTSRSVGNELKMIGDISAGVGAPIGEIAYLYGTARTQGRLFSRDIYQLSGRGIPIIAALAKQFKVSESAVMGLVEKGKVGFPQMQAALADMTKEGGQFFNMMDAQSQTLGGSLSNMGDVWEQLKVHIGESQQGILKQTVTWLTSFIGNVDAAVQVSNKITGVIEKYEEKTGKQILAGKKRGVIGSFLWGDDEGDRNEKIFSKLQDDINLYTGSLKTLRDVQLAGRFLGQQSSRLDLEEKLARSSEQKDAVLGKRALIEQGFEDITAFKKNFWAGKATDYLAGKNKITGGEGGAKGKGLGTGTTIENQAPKNMYITINGGLIKEMQINSIDGDIPSVQIKEKVSTVLLEVLNDAYLAQS